MGQTYRLYTKIVDLKQQLGEDITNHFKITPKFCQSPWKFKVNIYAYENGSQLGEIVEKNNI